MIGFLFGFVYLIFGLGILKIKLEIKWMGLDEELIIVFELDFWILIDSYGSLILLQVEFLDIGLWICEVINLVGIVS